MGAPEESDLLTLAWTNAVPVAGEERAMRRPWRQLGLSAIVLAYWGYLFARWVLFSVQYLAHLRRAETLTPKELRHVRAPYTPGTHSAFREEPPGRLR